MTTKRKPPGPVRQFSLRSASPQRPLFRKQVSTESAPGRADTWHTAAGTGAGSALKRPPRLAWVDRENSVEIVATKCSEHRKPPTRLSGSATSSTVLPSTEALLYSRQQLAERLRKAWKDREQNKRELDIFLAHNAVIQDAPPPPCSDRSSPDHQAHQFQFYPHTSSTPETAVVPQEVTNCYTPSTNASTTRDRNLKKISLVISACSLDADEPPFDDTDSVLIPNGGLEEIPAKNTVTESTILQNNWVFEKGIINHVPPPVQVNETVSPTSVIPVTSAAAVVEAQGQAPPKVVKCDPKATQGCNNVVMVPLTAAARRESFQKNGNRAFSGSVSTAVKDPPKPPLTRTLSVPTTPDGGAKIKFTPVKRRLKTAPARRKPPATGGDTSGGEDDTGAADKTAKGRAKKKGVARCRSAGGTEIVTMVSLTSPPASDAEEAATATATAAAVRILGRPAKAATAAKLQNDTQRMMSLRKTIKQVSFQQSALTTVRSYSAGYPLRRGSLAVSSFGQSLLTPAAAALLVVAASSPSPATPTTTTTTTTTPPPPIAEREKRAPAPNETRGPKRRLLRMASSDARDQDASAPEAEEEVSTGEKSVNFTECAHIAENAAPKTVEEDAPESDADEPKFENPKEKQCWKMYKKMCDKGVAVSFDTILKGILTPTEYRLRTKEVLKEDVDAVGE